MSTLVVSGTGTGIGKTVVTAALAALARAEGRSVVVVKPAQTGVSFDEPGDCAEVRRLAEIDEVLELARFPDPLAPATAARMSGRPCIDLHQVAGQIRDLSHSFDLVLVEGAGGLLVHLDTAGGTVADLAIATDAPVIVVARPDLGTLNHTQLTLEALRHRGLDLAGVVIGSWPDRPDLACRCNVADLETVIRRPLSGAIRSRAATLSPDDFLAAARAGLAPELGGEFDAAAFRAAHSPDPTQPHVPYHESSEAP